MHKAVKCRFPDTESREKLLVCNSLNRKVFDKPFTATVKVEGHGSHRCDAYIQIGGDYAFEWPEGCGKIDHQ